MLNYEEVLVSVIVPTYNRSKVIKNCIESILNQTYSNLEVIVVDDASEDDTESIVKSITDSRLQYIRIEQNTQGTMPRSIGIEKSTGQYIAFLDSDDIWLPEKIEKQLSYIRECRKKDVLCATGIVYAKNSATKTIINRKPYQHESIMDYILNVGWVQCGTFLCSSEIAKKTKFGANVRKHQDWDFCHRLAKNNCEFIYLEEALTIYNIDETSNQISTNYRFDLSIEWINSIKGEISQKNYYAFLINQVSHDLIRSKKRLKAWEIYKEAYENKAISSFGLLKGIVKSLV